MKLDNNTIQWYYDVNLGNCFRINYKPGLNPDFDIYNVNAGLHLEMYAGIPSPLSFAVIRGLQIEIKSHDGYPFVFLGHLLNVRTHTEITIKPKLSKMLPKPYSNCVNLDTYKSPHASVLKKLGITYTRENCLDINTQLMIIRNFGCYYAR